MTSARIQLRASRRNSHRHLASTSNLTSLERGLHGVEPPMVHNLPAKKFGDQYFSSVESGQCSICLAEYQKEDMLHILPYCSHYFHINCIDIWLLQRCTCPVCRVSLREKNDRKWSLQLISRSQSNHSLESSRVLSSHCRFFSTTLETHRMDPIQEDKLLSHVEVEEVGDLPSHDNDDISKEPKQKHVESASLGTG